MKSHHSNVALPSEDLMSAREERRPQRNHALDFTKGALVLFMVLYHWLNYFVSPHGFYYGYLRFVTTSFILISGYLITNAYLPKFRVAPSDVRNRLIVRGLRLLLLFTALNLAAGFVASKSYNGKAIGVSHFFSNAPEIFGVGKGEAAVFGILVPIAYLLLAGPFALAIHRRYNVALPLICALIFSAISILALFGYSSSNLNWFGVGVLGLVLGVLREGWINRFSRRLSWLLGAYVVYVAVITFAPTPYPVQVFGACLSVLVIYSIGIWCGSAAIFSRHVILLGQYSLLGYIAQIAALQVLHRLLVSVPSEAARLGLSMVGVILMTSGAVIFVDLATKRFPLAKAIYRLVFS